MLAGAEDVPQVLLLPLVEITKHSLEQHLREPDHGVQRSPQLVGHARQEVRLVLAGHFQLGALALELTKESRVGHRQRGLVGKRLHEVHDVAREVSRGLPPDHHDADDLTVAQYRDGKDRPPSVLVQQLQMDVPVYQRDIGDRDRAPLAPSTADEGRPIPISDIALVDRDVHLELLYQDGWRSVLAVPVLRHGQIIGVMVVRRKSPGNFSGDVMDFMETFANQSALAVSNARLFRELERKSAQLEVASEHKSDFLASMSHELRTPLNAVIGFSEVLLEQMFGDLNERQEEYLRDILSSGKHLLELLNEILDLSKVEAGRMELEPSVFPVRGVIEDTIALVRERAAIHGIGLTLEIDPALNLIESDELRFKQVMLNLLSNAVKFTPDGGHIAVKAARTERRMTVTVRDSGIGIPSEDQERIFEAFHQGRRGPSREDGTGLGLTLCRRIVALMGGVMTLQSEVGVGSTFGFTVPVLAADGSVESDNRDDTDPVVVVVDDDRRSLDLMSAYLDGHGVRVVRARGGNEGLDRIRRLQPVAALLDIRFPVIIVSILDEKSRGLAAGAVEYLVKPVGRDDLLDALRRLRVLPGNNREREL